MSTASSSSESAPSQQAAPSPVPLLCDPYDGGALVVSASGGLSSLDGLRHYTMRTHPHALYELFMPSPDAPTHQRSQTPWDPARFDKHYEDTGYYEDGATYEREVGMASELTQFHQSRVKDFLPRWISPEAGHTIMDVGCGAGWFLERIWSLYHEAGHHPKVVGLEASQVQAEFTAQRMAAKNLTDGLTVLGNAERLPFKDDSFDLITCSETLEQVGHPARAVAEMARVLKPGGRLLLSAPSRLSEVMWDFALAPAVNLIKAIRRKPSAPGFGEYYAALYPEELQSQVTVAGLKLKEVVQNGVIPHNHYFYQLPTRVVPPLVRLFDWVEHRFGSTLHPFAGHILIWAEKPNQS